MMIRLILILLAVPAVVLPLLSLGYIFVQAAPWFSVTVLLGDAQQHSMISSGLVPQIMGSLLLMGLACALAFPAALSLALFDMIYANASQRRVLAAALQLLQGIPPIVYGLCALVVLVHLFHWGISLVSGALVLAVVILPLLTENIMHALQRIAPEQTEAAKNLGLSAWHIVVRVWLPVAWSDILTGVLLAMARALSETAPILFTATVFSGVSLPDSIWSPVSSLQTHIFYLAQEASNKQAMGVAWVSAALLLLLVLGLSVVAWWLRQRRLGA